MAPVLDKVFRVLDIVGQGPINAAKAASLTGLNRSTVTRILGDLEHSRFVVRDLLGRFVIGPRFTEFETNRAADPLQFESHEILTTLQKFTGSDVLLFRPDGDDRVCIGACLGEQMPTHFGMKLGTRLPPSNCASALVLLAWTASRRFAATHLEIPGGHLDTIRKRGWATSSNGNGESVISAPVRDQVGDVIAAIGIFGGDALATPTSSAFYVPKLIEASTRLTDAMRRAPQ